MGAKRVEGLLVERLDGELLVVKQSSHEAHALNEAAAVVFDLCDGSTSRTEMVAEVERRTKLPADEGVVDLALAELVDAGLVVLEDEASATVTRRALMRRLALSATVAAMLPIVETVLVPSPASGQSAPPPSLSFAPPTSSPPAPTSSSPPPAPTSSVPT